MLGKEAGQVRDDNGLKMKLVWCPPGFLTMEQVETNEEPAIVEEPATNDDVVQDEPTKGQAAGGKSSLPSISPSSSLIRLDRPFRRCPPNK